MRNRWMYYATGLPGWMRFGYSPGWINRSPNGLGPCASYMMTGTWPSPQAQDYWQEAVSPVPVNPYYGWREPMYPQGFTKEQELEMLKGEADMLNQQIQQIQNRIDELEKDHKE